MIGRQDNGFGRLSTIGCVWTIDLGVYLFIGIVWTIHFGDCLFTWNCLDNWFQVLSINWNCPDNWFRRRSIDWNCPDDWFGRRSINRNCLRPIGFGLCLLTGIDEAIDFCTRPENVYTHKWNVGDVLIWDERATLHRGQPWSYGEPRTLKSICCSVVETDGVSSVRIVWLAWAYILMSLINSANRWKLVLIFTGQTGLNSLAKHNA